MNINFLLLVAFLLLWGGAPQPVSANPKGMDSASWDGIQTVSLSEEADLSRSTDGETFEEDSHESEHEASDLGDHEDDSHSDLQDHEEGFQEGETEHDGSEGERGEAPESGGGERDRER